MLSPSQKKTTYLDNWNLIFDFARMHLSHLDEEALLCLFLTPTKRLIKHEIFSNGTINSIDIPTHKIISRCVSLKASFLILFLSMMKNIINSIIKIRIERDCYDNKLNKSNF